MATFQPPLSRLNTIEVGAEILCSSPFIFVGLIENDGRVDPVDPVLLRVVDRSNRWLVVLRTPAVLPIPAADRPGAEA